LYLASLFMARISTKISYKALFWLLFYIFLFCLLIRNGSNYLDPDLGWHLKVGQEISWTGQMPSSNHYNYTFTGEWVDHEWLSNFLLFQAYDRFGYPTVVIIFAVIFVGILAGLTWLIKKRYPEVPDFTIIGLQLIGTVAALPHAGVRVQELSWLFLFLLLIIIDRYNIKKKWPVLLFLLPLMYVWACMHGSFLIGFFLLIAWPGIKLMEKLIRRYRPRWPIATDPWPIRRLLIIGVFIGLVILGTLLTPYYLDLYAFLGGYTNTAYLGKIQEWLSQFFFPFNYWQLAYLAIASLALIIYLYERLYQRRGSVDLWRLFLLLLFIGLSFKSRRHFPLMFVATLPFLAVIYAEIFSSLGGRRPGSAELEGQAEKAIGSIRRWTQLGHWLKINWLHLYIVLCLTLAILWQAVNISLPRDPFKSFCRDYPCGAYDFLSAHAEYKAAPIFNNYGWGGYFIWLMPDKKLFIDGRLPQVEYEGRTFLEEYLDFYESDGLIKDRLDKYHIRLVLIPTSETVILAKKWEQLLFSLPARPLNQTNHLREYLLSSLDWSPIYYDRSATIFYRNE